MWIRDRDVVVAAAAALLPPGPGLDPDAVDEALARPRFKLEYLALVDEDTFVPQGELGPRSRLVVAALLGSTRLIDNLSVAVPPADRSAPAHGAFPPVSAYPAKDATA